MDMDTDDHGDDLDNNGDGDGVWSEAVEQCFREALILFPPCGRRKTVLPDGGGKMYGRNELIARFIEMRTGEVRTRKQVSSHIQVLARRKAKAEAEGSSGASGVSPSPSVLRSGSQSGPMTPDQIRGSGSLCYDAWLDRPIATQKIRLVEFSAFIDYRRNKQEPTSLASPPPVSICGPTSTSGHQPSQQQLATLQDNSMIDLKPQQLPVSDYSQQQHQPVTTMAINSNSSAIVTTQPLASNHYLPAQFNQSSTNQVYHHDQNQQPYNHHQLQQQNQHHNHHHNHHHHQNQQQQQQQHPQMLGTANNFGQDNNGAQPVGGQQANSGFSRHYYVKIDYSRNCMGMNQSPKLERINISQVQDKFPEIGGPDGLFQRCPQNSFFLVKFWADLNEDLEHHIEDQNSFLGFSYHFETLERHPDLTCSTKACSYGLQVVEKVEKIYGALNETNGHYSFEVDRSPMCKFMIQFIKKLRQLPRVDQMNSVLENFTVLQVISNESRSEILFCLAYAFGVVAPEQASLGPHYNVYRLTRD